MSCDPGQTVQFGFLVWKQFDLAAHKRKANCCRKADPFQGPKLGSCLTVRNELSEETLVLTKQEILLGKGTRVESSRVRDPRRTALPPGSPGFYGDGISFRIVFGQSF